MRSAETRRSACSQRSSTPTPELLSEAAARAGGELGSTTKAAVARAVERALRAVTIEHAWDRSGHRADGSYVEETEAIWAVAEDALEPFLADLRRRIALGRWEEADALCRGIVRGLDRLAAEPTAFFADHAPDVLDTLAWHAVETWRKPAKDGPRRGPAWGGPWTAMQRFLACELQGLESSLVRALSRAPGPAATRARKA
jgi:hypothetical protein